MQEIERLAHFKYFILLFLVYININLKAQVYPDGRVDSLIKKGITCIVNQDYTGAELFFQNLTDEFPNLPLGKIYLAANKIARSFDYAYKFDAEIIYEYLEDAKEHSILLLKSDDENIWHLYFYALVEGYFAYLDALNDNWLSAFSTGYNSISTFEECLDFNKKFYESYIAIATYAYWKSRKTEFLNWVPFVNDDREFAIDQLKVAADSASYNRYLAINSLIWIYIDKKEFNEAINISLKALTEFPHSRIFKWGLARAYEDGNPLKAIEIYFEILNSYPVEGTQNHINEIILKHIIAQQYYKLGENKNSLALCNEIISIKNLSEFAKIKLEERIKRVYNLKEELEHLN